MIFGEVMEVVWHPGKANEAFDITLGRHWSGLGLVLRKVICYEMTLIYISVVRVFLFWVIELSRSMMLFLSI